MIEDPIQAVIKRDRRPYKEYCCVSSENGKNVVFLCNDNSGMCNLCHVFKLVNNSWEKYFTFKSWQPFDRVIWSNNLLLVSGQKSAYVVNTEVLSLKDLAFRVLFRQLISIGMSLQKMKDVLDLPVFLSRQYFAHEPPGDI